jgi:hypothetical protein
MNSFYEITGNAGHSCKKKVTETVVMELAAAVEAEPKEAGHQVLVFGESNHAVPDVARRQNVQFFPKAPGAASIIRNRHYDG